MENEGQNTEPVGEDQQLNIQAAQLQAYLNPQPPAQVQPMQQPPVQVQPVQPSTTQVQPMQQPQQLQQSQAPSIQQIIDQQNAQISALMAQNQALNEQVISMVQGGAQFNKQAKGTPQTSPEQNPYPSQVQQMGMLGAQPDPFASTNPPSLSSGVDVSLEGLAKEIGKGRNEEK